MRAYRFLQWLLRAATRVFFRRIEVVGLHNLPPDAALVFCGNHPNSLLDPILITAWCGRIVHFAAKDVLFENRILRLFFGILGAVPVRRRMDHPDGPLDNRSMFAALHEVLGAGRSVGIFPEGISHDESQLAPLKTGAARVALGAAERFPDRPVFIVPCGLCYFTRHRFRSSVLIQFGAPIAVPAQPSSEVDERAGVRELTQHIEVGLRALTINADTWETIWVLDGVRRMYQPEGISLEERAELARRFNTVYPTVQDQADVRRLYDRMRDYLFRLSAAGLSDTALRRELSLRETFLRVAQHVGLLLFSLPLFVIGAPIHLPLAVLFKIVGNHFAPRADTVATTKFLVGFLTILLVYTSIACVFTWHYGVWWGVLVAILLPLSGRAVVHVLGRVDALRHVVLTTLRILWLRKEVRALRAERTVLQKAVVALVDRYRPLDMEPIVEARADS